MTTIQTWRERAGLSPDYQLTRPSAVEKAMEAEIAELREVAQWVSVDDERKPEAGTPVLLYVRTLMRGWDGEGRPYETEGAEVAMGEYRKGESAAFSYFDCYTSPMSDSDWITHWMPLPTAPTSEAQP